MACLTVKPLCERLVLSQSVTYNSDVLIVNIPAGQYLNGEKYCLVLAQDIPAATTIGANIVITIGSSSTYYAVLNCDNTEATALDMKSRVRYMGVVDTNTNTFKLLGRSKCHCCKKALGD